MVRIDRSCVQFGSINRKFVDSHPFNSFRQWLEIAAHHEEAFGERENGASAKSHRKLENLKFSDLDKHPNLVKSIRFSVPLNLAVSSLSKVMDWECFLSEDMITTGSNLSTRLTRSIGFRKTDSVSCLHWGKWWNENVSLVILDPQIQIILQI